MIKMCEAKTRRKREKKWKWTSNSDELSLIFRWGKNNILLKRWEEGKMETTSRKKEKTFTFVCAIIALHNLLQVLLLVLPLHWLLLSFREKFQVPTRRKFFQKKIFGQVVNFLLWWAAADELRCSMLQFHYHIRYDNSSNLVNSVGCSHSCCGDMLWIKLFTQKPSQNVKTISVCLLQLFSIFPHGFSLSPLNKWPNTRFKDRRSFLFDFAGIANPDHHHWPFFFHI